MARLIVVEGPDRGCEFALANEPGGSVIVGRDPRNLVPLNDSSVSREHLRIEFTGRGYRLVDLGSKNRTFLNGEPVREWALRHGDRIGVGDSELRFEDDRAVVEEEGFETTIMKEIRGQAGIDGLLEGLDPKKAVGDERLGGVLESIRRVFSLSRTLSGSESLVDLYADLVSILGSTLKADHGAVLTLEGGRWSPAAVLSGGTETGRAGPPGSPAGPGQNSRMAVSESIVRRAADEGKAILSANTRRDARFREKESVVDAGIFSAMAAPIIPPARSSEAGKAGGPRAVLGVIYLDRRGADRPFTEKDLEVLSAAAEQASAVAGPREEADRLRNEKEGLLRTIFDSKRIVGRSRAIGDVLEFIRRAAPASQTVLIRGETGTGKELVAMAIHYQGPRRGKPFIPVNCAAIPENLMESELFGHEKGAFTGAASRRKGRFELAEGGTVFLDEVAEMSAGCQAKLLRLLEDRRFERLGGSETVQVDVRIIAATNKDLAAALAAGQFREDLFYRLNVLGVTLPPLRERPEDIPLLVQHFLDDVGGSKRSFSPEAVEKLQAFSWPGNIRQLRNAIESAFVLGSGAVIGPDEIVLGGQPTVRTAAPEGGPGRPGESSAERWEPTTLEEVQRRHIQRVLVHTGGNKKRAAEILGIERCTLYAKLKSLALQPPSKTALDDDETREEEL